MTLDLAAAKRSCRVVNDTHDEEIDRYLKAAVQWVEDYTRKPLEPTEVTARFDAFTDRMMLYYEPVISINEIAYTDTGGLAATLPTATFFEQYMMTPEGGWPAIQSNSVIIVKYTAGLVDRADKLEAAVLALTADYFNNNGGMSPDGERAVRGLCRTYRPTTLA